MSCPNLNVHFVNMQYININIIIHAIDLFFHIDFCVSNACTTDLLVWRSNNVKFVSLYGIILSNVLCSCYKAMIVGLSILTCFFCM